MVVLVEDPTPPECDVAPNTARMSIVTIPCYCVGKGIRPILDAFEAVKRALGVDTQDEAITFVRRSLRGYMDHLGVLDCKDMQQLPDDPSPEPEYWTQHRFASSNPQHPTAEKAIQAARVQLGVAGVEKTNPGYTLRVFGWTKPQLVEERAEPLVENCPDSGCPSQHGEDTDGA